MQLKDLPTGYKEWTVSYAQHLEKDLKKSHFTIQLFKQYKKHLGWFRYFILIEAQKLLVPKRVKQLLGFGSFSMMSIILPIYKFSGSLKLDNFLKELVLPAKYKAQVKELDVR